MWVSNEISISRSLATGVRADRLRLARPLATVVHGRPLAAVDSSRGGDARLDEILHEPGDVLHYLFDYGDSWELTLRLEGVRPGESRLTVCGGHGRPSCCAARGLRRVGRCRQPVDGPRRSSALSEAVLHIVLHRLPRAKSSVEEISLRSNPPLPREGRARRPRNDPSRPGDQIRPSWSRRFSAAVTIARALSIDSAASSIVASSPGRSGYSSSLRRRRSAPN